MKHPYLALLGNPAPTVIPPCNAMVLINGEPAPIGVNTAIRIEFRPLEGRPRIRTLRANGCETSLLRKTEGEAP